MKTLHLIILLAVLLLAFPRSAIAQTPEFRLDVNRDFGYGAGSNVRGTFTNRIYGAQENIASVTFMLDDQVMAEVTQPPFSFKYHTDNYPSGRHEMTAVVTTTDGREVVTPPVSVNLLTAQSQNVSMQRIFLPLGLVLAVVAVIGIGSQVLMTRRNGPPKPGAERHYGFKGGTICPRCGRTYPIHFFSINLIGGVIDRCDYCGKVAFVRSQPRAILDAAVAAERAAARAEEHSLPGLAGSAAQSELSDEERARKLLDDSRYLE